MRLVFVLGMGRSGSSALARVLALCGGRLPDGLLPANRFNPTGYWEPQAAVQANARFLADSGSSFFDTQLDAVPPVDSAAGKSFVATVRDILARWDDASTAPLIVKEPRISLLLPYWLAAADALGLSVGVAIPIRHPAAAAASLAGWKGLSIDHGELLWFKYNLLAERDSRGLPRVFVGFDTLLADWRGVVAAVARGLSIELVPNDAVDAFIDPALRHCVGGTPFWLTAVHDTLSAACDGRGLDCGVLDAAFARIARAQAAGDMPVRRSFGVDYGLAG